MESGRRQKPAAFLFQRNPASDFVSSVSFARTGSLACFTILAICAAPCYNGVSLLNMFRVRRSFP